MWGIRCPFCFTVTPLFSDKRGLPYTTCPHCLTRFFFKKPEFIVRFLVRMDESAPTDKKYRKTWVPARESLAAASHIIAHHNDVERAIDFFWRICANWGVRVTTELRDKFVDNINRLSPKEIRNPHTLLTLISSILEGETEGEDDFEQRLAKLQEKLTTDNIDYLKMFEEMLHGRVQGSYQGGSERSDRERTDKS